MFQNNFILKCFSAKSVKKIEFQTQIYLFWSSLLLYFLLLYHKLSSGCQSNANVDLYGLQHRFQKRTLQEKFNLPTYHYKIRYQYKKEFKSIIAPPFLPYTDCFSLHFPHFYFLHFFGGCTTPAPSAPSQTDIIRDRSGQKLFFVAWIIYFGCSGWVWKIFLKKSTIFQFLF